MRNPSEEYTPGPGDIVVLRGLHENPKKPNSAAVPPKIGLVVKLLPQRRAYVKMHMGRRFSRNMNFAKKGRVVDVACIFRPATPRERALGLPMIDTAELRAVAS